MSTCSQQFTKTIENQIFLVIVDGCFLKYLHAGKKYTTTNAVEFEGETTPHNQKASCSSTRSKRNSLERETKTYMFAQFTEYNLSVITFFSFNFLICKNITAALPEGAVVKIRREKPSETLKYYINGGTINF